MSYVTRLDLEARFGADEIRALAPLPGGAADVNGDGELVDEDAVPLDPQPVDARIGASIADACALVDAELSKAYELPLPSTYALLVRVTADIARAQLYDEELPEHLAARARQAIAQLRALVSGDAELLDADHVVVARRSTAQFVGQARRFTAPRADGRLGGLDFF